MANVDINVVLALSLQVYLKAPMILNGVCVIWKGWIDLQRLDGMGYLEYDDERAQVSPVLLFTQMSFPHQETNYDLSLLSFVLAARGRSGSGRVRRGSTQDERLWGQRAIAQRGSRGERRGIADYLCWLFISNFYFILKSFSVLQSPSQMILLWWTKQKNLSYM